MAGFRAGYALANDAELVERLSPAGGVSAPAQAAMLWAVREGDALVARRRAAAARERERLAAGPQAYSMMTSVRGASNAKAKRELGWEPRHTWRNLEGGLTPLGAGEGV